MAGVFKNAGNWVGRVGGRVARSSLGRGGLNAGLVLAGGAMGLVTMTKAADKWREGVMKGLYPGSALPAESGRFGIRTGRTQAGVDGLRFNFRRK